MNKPTDLDLLRGHRYVKAMRKSRVLDDVETWTLAGLVISHIVAHVIDRRAKLEAEKRGGQ